MIRKPTDNTKEIRDSILDIINVLNTSVSIEIKTVGVTAVASTTVTIKLSTKTMRSLSGAVQIASTFTEQAYVKYNDTQSLDVSWDFGASTSGEQTVTFLLIGV